MGRCLIDMSHKTGPAPAKLTPPTSSTLNLARSRPPGVLATKVGYFGVKSARVLLEQMGT